MKHLKNKIDAGAEYIVTQMFFDNAQYFEYLKKCKEQNINVPIIPGLKPLTTRKQIANIPRTFSVSFPEALANELEKCTTDEAVTQVGREWSIQQSKELLKFGVPVLHFYTMSNAGPVTNIMKALV